MRLHENAIRASTISTNVLLFEEGFPNPKPWILPEALKKAQDLFAWFDEEYDQFLRHRYGLVD